MPRIDLSDKARYALWFAIILTFPLVEIVLHRFMHMSILVAGLGALLVWYLCGFVVGKTVRGRMREAKRVLPYSVAKVQGHVTQVVGKLNWKVEKKDEGTGLTIAETRSLLGMSILPPNRHQRVGIQVKSLSESSSEVNVASRTPLLVDWGQDKRTLARFLRELENSLSS